MGAIHVLVVRDDSSSSAMNPNMLNLIIALVALMGAGFSLGLGFYLLRRMRTSRSRHSRDLQVYTDSEKPTRSITHRGLTYLSTSNKSRNPKTNLVVQERLDLINNSTSPPTSPIPEIRITFPDEVDEMGKRLSGRVVVVKVGETSLGLEPLRSDEKCPPYQASEAERFQSLDLERIGGLKEGGVQPKGFM